MPKSSIAVPSPLRAARLAEGHGWSLRAVARKIHPNPTSLSEWERGVRQPPSDIQVALCKVYRAKPADLGFAEGAEAKDGDITSEHLSRRAFLVGALAVPVLIGASWSAQANVTGEILETLAAVNERYRAVQVQGLKYSREQLLRHITTIEHLLDTTLHAGSRRDLYVILARAQLLARAGGTTAERLTLTERALASAQLGGDKYLQAAMTHGHPTALVASDLTAAAVAFLASNNSSAGLMAYLRDYVEREQRTYHGSWLGELWQEPGATTPEDFIKRGWAECLVALDRLSAALAHPDRDADPCLATGEGWVTEEALATGLLCFLLFPNDGVAAVRRAATSSGDSDSIACLAGAFAGAALDMEAWPPEWFNHVEYRDSLMHLGVQWDTAWL